MKCEVFCCLNKRKKTRGKSFFKFPREQLTADLWLKEIGREGAQVNDNRFVCEDHFDEELIFQWKDRKVVDKEAIPHHDYKSCATCASATMNEAEIHPPNGKRKRSKPKAPRKRPRRPKAAASCSTDVKSEEMVPCEIYIKEELEDIEIQNLNPEIDASNRMEYTELGEWCSSSTFTDDGQFEDFGEEKEVITSLEVVPLKYEIVTVPVEELCKNATTSVGDTKATTVNVDGEILAQFYAEAVNSTQENKSPLHKMVNSVEDIQGSCRVCLAHCFKGQSIFSTYKGNYLPQIIHSLTQIIVTKDDELPSTICFKCADVLLQAELIRKSCISSDKFLKNQQRIKSREIISVETNKPENKTNQTTSGNGEMRCRNENERQNNNTNKEIINANDPLSLSEENIRQEEVSKESEDIFLKKEERMKFRETKLVENTKNRNVTIEAISEYEEADWKSNDERQNNNLNKESPNANEFLYDPLSDENIEDPLSQEQEVVSKNRRNRFLKKNHEMKLRKNQSVGNVKSGNVKKHVASKNYGAGYRNNNEQQINTNNESLNISETPDDPLLEESNRQEVFIESIGNKNKNATGEKTIPLLPELYVCAICAKRYTNFKSFNRHQRYHSSRNVRCPICPEEIDLKFINEHVLDHKKKHQLICGDCDNTFDDLTNLYKHIIAHGKNATLADRVYERYVYECDLCDNKTSILLVHQKHMKEKHGTRDTKPFKCYQCAERFSSKIIVLRHFNHYHNPKTDKEKDKKFVCPTCGKKFLAKGNLKTHMRGHTGEKPYKCHYCDKRFAYDVTLRMHIHTHTGEKPFLCSICGKGFKQYGHFKYHQMMHSDKRPHVCNICHHGFRVKSSLTTHMKIHGKKEFSCEICGNEYTMRCLLNKHMKQKHGMELV